MLAALFRECTVSASESLRSSLATINSSAEQSAVLGRSCREQQAETCKHLAAKLRAEELEYARRVAAKTHAVLRHQKMALEVTTGEQVLAAAQAGLALDDAL